MYSVVFIGGSVINTPKVEMIYESMVRNNQDVELITLSKFGHNKGLSLSYNSSNYFLKFIKYIYSIILIFFKLMKIRPDLVYVINPYGGLVVFIYSYLFKKKYIYETLEIFLGTKNNFVKGWKKYFFYFIERIIAQKSSYFIGTDQFRIKFLRRFYKINPLKCHYLLNTYVFSNDSFHKKTNDDFILSYCGIIMPGRGIEEIIKSIKYFKSNCILWLVGGWNSDEYFQQLNELVISLEVEDRIKFFGQVSNTSLKKYMAESDITFAFYKKDCVNNRLCSPNKFFDAIGCNTKLITTNCFLSRFLLKRGVTISIVNKVCTDDIVSSINFLSDKYNFSNLELSVFEFSWKEEEKKLFKILSL